MDKIEQIKNLTANLLQHCHNYYDLDAPIISDQEYDKLWDELKALEDKTGFLLTNSPTRKVQGSVLDGFVKVTHSKPMLSAAKTKDINEIQKFADKNTTYCSWKLDGLTLVVIYENGEFLQAITRGTGTVGEDVTEQAKMITNLPMHINYHNRLELRGECVVDWRTFNKINEILKEPYSHPRNLAAGSLRNLDTNITKQRGLSYIIFESVTDLSDEKLTELEILNSLGFETVETFISYKDGKFQTNDCINDMNPSNYKYPVDGIIFEYSNKSYSKSLPSTSHHEGCRIALKWADDMYETILRDIEWNPTRTGLISPVAVFDEIDLSGALTTRATLHNVYIIKNLELGIGDTITVYRSNMVIPKIDDNLTRSNTYQFPKICPCCGHPTEIKSTDNSEVLMCTNQKCPAKQIAKFTHFVSRKCMDINGMSEAIIEKLMIHGLLTDYKSIYHLKDQLSQIERIDGFGKKSTMNLLESIEKSRHVTLEKYLNAIGIPGIGYSAAKTVSKAFNGDHFDFISALESGYDFTQLDDFGEITNQSLHDWWARKDPMVELLPMELHFIKDEKQEIQNSTLNGMTFCITGSLTNYSNRNALIKDIELHGGKYVNTISLKCNYLINNDVTSSSSKNQKAKNLNINIITEMDYETLKNGN